MKKTTDATSIIDVGCLDKCGQKNVTIMKAAFNRKVVFQGEKRDNQSTFCTLYKHMEIKEEELEPPFDVSAVRGGSSAEVDTVGLEAIHPLSSSPPAPSSLSLLLQ
ncbi:hypothetical protein D917_08150 [Trichinella nativa]|uniref:Uncharacterized protein n=1 Tax=Trichinella nativa TaxID=6335 RepID=A0A1Y3EQS7_9BILA|nr:hypothetical protein D917_08150 [Trichinella nativa]